MESCSKEVCEVCGAELKAHAKAAPLPTKLNLGCGKDVRDGWINCDNAEKLPPGVIRMDAGKPFPFPSNHFVEIYASHVLEHIHNYEDTIIECHRVLKPGGLLTVRVPFGFNPAAFHVRYLWPDTMNVFVMGSKENGSLQYDGVQRFTLEKTSIKRCFWFAWHCKHYLHINWFVGKYWFFPIGKKYEIIWRMRKRKEGTCPSTHQKRNVGSVAMRSLRLNPRKEASAPAATRQHSEGGG